MVDKIIHYCWFGKSEYSELTKRCIDSWRKYCPDFRIMLWNEDNVDLSINAYLKEAYDAGKWAFVSDVVRLQVLQQYGGVYLDTDVELLQPLDAYLDCNALGFEDGVRVAAGIIIAEKNSTFINKILTSYEDRHFIVNGECDYTTIVQTFTEVLVKNGLILNNKKQQIMGFNIYPSSFFYPLSSDTHVLTLNDSTVCIHHYLGSWVPANDSYRYHIRRKLSFFLPFKVASKIARVLTLLKFDGYKGVLSYIKKNR